MHLTLNVVFMTRAFALKDSVVLLIDVNTHSKLATNTLREAKFILLFQDQTMTTQKKIALVKADYFFCHWGLNQIFPREHHRRHWPGAVCQAVQCQPECQTLVFCQPNSRRFCLLHKGKLPQATSHRNGED